MLDRPTSSTGETEHQGLFLLSKELFYFRDILSDMGFPQQQATTMYCDNETAISFAKKARITQDNKYWDTRYMVVKSYYDDGILDPKYIGTHSNLADLGTKVHKDIQDFNMKRKFFVRPLQSFQ